MDFPSPREMKKAQSRIPLCLRVSVVRELYRETAANSSECINAWNCLSSLLKCSCNFELSESTVMASMAVFSIGVAFIFLYIMPALISDDSPTPSRRIRTRNF